MLYCVHNNLNDWKKMKDYIDDECNYSSVIKTGLVEISDDAVIDPDYSKSDGWANARWIPLILLATMYLVALFVHVPFAYIAIISVGFITYALMIHVHMKDVRSKEIHIAAMIFLTRFENSDASEDLDVEIRELFPNYPDRKFDDGYLPELILPKIYKNYVAKQAGKERIPYLDNGWWQRGSIDGQSFIIDLSLEKIDWKHFIIVRVTEKTAI